MVKNAHTRRADDEYNSKIGRNIPDTEPVLAASGEWGRNDARRAKASAGGYASVKVYASDIDNNGLAIVGKNGKAGVIDKRGERVASCAYDEALSYASCACPTHIPVL